ncbi:predicted GPI-anchored protein 58 [Sorghum bicolor]|uniref:predicted GPI-anchored protein 58 n=1 Tax=Sorghum bicolor TaxID=4558 RepID=UPI000B4262F9|nr:predicted GPI-anchored protein 58 [Sorghum bicolor]|eukprot:XP_021312022.1 predicted GPI-anchored protein 58 [Sorghum bicolor]
MDISGMHLVPCSRRRAAASARPAGSEPSYVRTVPEPRSGTSVPGTRIAAAIRVTPAPGAARLCRSHGRAAPVPVARAPARSPTQRLSPRIAPASSAPSRRQREYGRARAPQTKPTAPARHGQEAEPANK